MSEEQIALKSSRPPSCRFCSINPVEDKAAVTSVLVESKSNVICWRDNIKSSGPNVPPKPLNIIHQINNEDVQRELKR